MKLRILILEDEVLIAFDIQKVLQSKGHYVVDIASSFDEAVGVAEQEALDLIVSDIQLADDIDGITCSEFLQKEYSLQIIFITAFKDRHLLQKAASLDFIGYLIKPFRQDELEALLDIAMIKSTQLRVISSQYSYLSTTHTLFFKDTEVLLSVREQSVIELLLRRNNTIVPYSVIDELLGSGEVVQDAARRQFFHRLKSKLPEFPLEIKKGVGCCIRVEKD